MENKLLNLAGQRKCSYSTLSLSLFILFFFTFGFTKYSKAQTAAFTPSATQSCSPANISFTDNSIGATSWLWDFGNSNTATTQNASANYPQPGTYSVTLTINGGASTVTKLLSIYPKLSLSNPAVVQGCAPFTTSLTAIATPVIIAPFSIGSSLVGGITGGAAASYTWNFFGDLPTVTENDPVLDLINVPEGTYDVLLTVTDDKGCSNFLFKQGIITVHPKPDADFTFVKENICGVGNVTFSGVSSVSSGSIANYSWDIGNDGSIESTLQNYTHNFNAAGTYDVAFTTTSSDLCSSDKIVKQVVFNSNNQVGFTFTGNCVGQSVAFTDASSADVVSRDWDFGDASAHSALQNPSHTYTSTGDKTAKLTVTFTDGCVMETTHLIPINGATSTFTYTTTAACAPNYAINFTSTATASLGSTITGYEWDFDNNGTADDVTATPTHAFNASGTFPVRLTVTTSDGCSNSIVSNVDVPASGIDFTAAPDQGCAPLNSAFTSIYNNASDPIISYSWDFGDPVSGANNTSAVANPSHNYINTGEYDVTLTVTTTNGCVLTKNNPQIINVGAPQAISNVTYTQATLCQTSAVDFTASITTLTDQLVWDFNDGTTPVTQNVSGVSSSSISHGYAIPGLQSVTVQAWYNGCPSLSSFTLSNIIINEPTASFTPSSTVQCAVPTANISFANTSHSTDAVTNYTWDFGDGQNSTDKNPSHIYNLTGDFTVTLTVNNTATGCSDQATSTVYVTTSVPQFTANSTVICSASPVNFTNQVAANSSANFSAASYLWTFGDGQTSTDANPSHTYTTPGLYSVKLQVTEQRGCVYSYTRTNYIDVRGPIVNFTNDPTQICSGTLVTFTDASTIAANDPANPLLNTFYWSFGDGNNSTDQNPTHTYFGTGSYTVNLQVTDNLGCVSSNAVTNSVSVPEITAGFTTSSNAYCKNDIVTFTNSAVGTVTAYDWDLNGDGTFEILNGAASQSYTYTATGVYSIKQRITSNLGCQDIFTKDITIVDGTAGIYISSLSLGCAPAFGQFEATDAAADVASYLWNFGDGQTSVLRNPNHYFILPGSYTVSLTEILTGGCIRTSSVVITVDGAVGTFTYDITPGCANHTVNYSVTNLSGVTELTWDFGDGITFTEPVAVGVTSKSTSHTYSTWGNRLPILILRDPACGDYSYYFGVNQRINTSEAPTPAFSFVSISGQTCEKLSFQFTDQSTRKDPRYNISTWDWDFGDGSPHSNLQNPIHMYNAAGTYTATLTVTNGFIPGGCSSSVSHSIIVNPLPVVSATNQTQEICSGTSSSSMVLSGTLPGTTFAWTRTAPAGITTAQAASGTTDIPGSVFTNSSSAPVVVTYTIIPTGPTPTFCIGDPITATVTVNPIPAVTSASTKSICNTTSVAYTPTSAVAGTTYAWTASLTSGAVTGFTASGSGPIADFLVNSGSANGSVTYVITPTGPAPTFCTGSSLSLVVTVRPTPVVTAPLTATICSGNSAAITLSTSVPGTTFYYAAPAISGSAGNITGGAARLSPGNTNAISDILVNTTAAVQTATYTVYPVINGCIGSSITIVVTVNPVPIVTTGIAQGICADASFNATSNLALTTSPAMAGALFTYAAPVNTGGMTGGTDRAVGSTANISDVFTNNTNTSQTATYSVTATAPAGLGGCAGAAKNVVVTVYPRPLITSSLTGTTCSSSAFSYTITSNVGSSTFTWTRVVVAGISNAAGSGSTSSINETLINTTGSSVDVSYILTPTGPAPGTCAGTPSILVVTVRPRPSVTAGLVQSFCSGSTASLVLTTTPDVPGTTFSWPMPTISGGAANIAGETARPAPGTTAPITDVLTNTTTSTRTATYVVTPTSPLGCIGLTRNVVISVYPNPTVSSAATKTICNNASVAYTPTSATASTTFSWTASLTTGSITGFSASGTGAISDILVNSGTSSGTVTYVITPTGPTPTFCIGTPRNLVVTVQPTPTVTATSAVPTFCSGGTTSIVLSTTVPGTTFYYASPTISGAAGNITGGVARVSPGSTAAIVNTLINTTASIQTATYNIIPRIGSCISTSVPSIITVNPVPIVTTGLAQGICTDASFNATSNLAITSTPAMAGALYTYPTPVNTGGMTGGTDRVVGSTANITDVFTNNTNTAQTATYSVSPAAPAGVGGCAGVTTNVVVTVYPRPLINSSITETVCSGSPFAYSITSNVASSTYTWTRAVVAGISNAAGSGSTASINETLINTTGSSVDVSYILTPTGPAPGNCAGTPSTLVVTVNPTPSVTSGLVQSNCSGTASNLAITTTPDVPGTTYSWPSPTISGVPGNITGGTARLAPGAFLPITDNLINTTTSLQTATYVVTPASPSGCVGASRNIVISVDPIPTVNSSSAKSICNSTSVAYTPTSATASTTFAWTASLTTGTVTGFTASGSGQINDVLVNSGIADGSVTYIVTPTGPAPTFCTGTPFTFVVTVRPTPTVSATPASQSFCSGGTTSIMLSTTVPGTTFYYAAPAVSGVPGNITGGTVRLTPGNTNAITDILVNTTATVQTATYTVYPIINGCVGTAETVVITVNPVPIVTTDLTQGICTDAIFNATSNLAITSTPAMAGALYTYPVPVNTGGMTGGTVRVVGSTANISDVFINNSNTAQTATYSVTATAPAGSGGCAGIAKNVIVTVYPRPLITSSLVGTTCSGSAFLYSITSNVASTSFTWTRAVVAGISNAAGSGSTASINETILNTTGSPIDVSYVLTPTGPAPGTCTGTSSTLVVSVKPRPAGVPQAKAICSGDVVNQALTTSPVVPGTTFTYAAPAVTGGITGGNPRIAGSSSDITDITSVHFKLTE